MAPKLADLNANANTKEILALIAETKKNVKHTKAKIEAAKKWMEMKLPDWYLLTSGGWMDEWIADLILIYVVFLYRLQSD